jgi:DNA polymerase III delta subunit
MASAKELLEDIARGNFKSVYYFFGSQDYRRTEAEKYIADRFLPKLQRSINYYKIDSKKTSAAELASALSNLPMLGEKQVYVVGNFETYKQKEMEKLKPYISSKDANRIIILSTSSSKTPSKKSAFLKEVSEFAETVEFNKLTERETKGLIINRLAKFKVSIEENALELLVGLVDGDKGGLDGELSKLIDYKGEGGKITIDDIREVCSGHELFGIFDLGNVIVEKNQQKILKMLNSLLGGGTSADFLVLLLQQHFISLYLVKNGKQPVGNRGFLVSRFREQSRGYSNSQLEQIIVALAEANVDLRHQRLTEELILEELTINLSNLN